MGTQPKQFYLLSGHVLKNMAILFEKEAHFLTVFILCYFEVVLCCPKRLFIFVSEDKSCQDYTKNTSATEKQ